MPDVFSKKLTPSYNRTDAHSFDPRELRIDEELNGRIDPPSDEDIERRVRDFLDPKVGQLQSILIAKDDDGHPIIIDGHIRWMAAMKITNEGKGPHDGVFKLKCTYFVGTPLERYIATIKANVRKDPTPADDGYNIGRLLHNFGMSKEDIAVKVYGRRNLDGSPDVKWVDERLAFADLAQESREALAKGKLKLSQVQLLAKLSKSAQRAKIKAAGDGKITSAMLRDKPEANGNGHVPNFAPPKVKDIRNFWKPYAEVDNNHRITRFAKAHESWISGETSADDFFEVVKSLLGA